MIEVVGDALGLAVDPGVSVGSAPARTRSVTVAVSDVYVPISDGVKSTRSLYVPRGSFTPNVGVYS